MDVEKELIEEGWSREYIARQKLEWGKDIKFDPTEGMPLKTETQLFWEKLEKEFGYDGVQVLHREMQQKGASLEKAKEILAEEQKAKKILAAEQKANGGGVVDKGLPPTLEELESMIE